MSKRSKEKVKLWTNRQYREGAVRSLNVALDIATNLNMSAVELETFLWQFKEIMKEMHDNDDIEHEFLNRAAAESLARIAKETAEV